MAAFVRLGPRGLALLLIIISSLACQVVQAETDQAFDGSSLAAIRVESGQEPSQFHGLIEPVEIHQLVVTVENQQAKPISPPITPRHQTEKKDLLDRLKRGSGSWNTNHPRHRLLDALYGYTKYYQRQSEELGRLKGLYKKVNKKQKALLEKHVQYSAKFDNIDALLKSNQELCDRIVDNALEFYQIDRSELEKHVKHLEADGKKADKVSISQSLKHIVRDWTLAGGRYERDLCFECLLKTLDTLFPDRGDDSKPVKILLPGAGLGRLGHDIAKRGAFEVTINEWSMYMNVAYRFLESHAHRIDSETVYPFVDSWSHHATTADMQRQLSFPDASLNASEVLLVEGDFITVFNIKAYGQYDVIVTYFFIDTARNLVSYFETIKKLLRPGGYWINLGPLLYGTAPFVQLSLEDIVDLVEKGLDFQFIDVAGSECGEITLPGRLIRGMEAAYGFDDKALTKNAYSAQFWVAQRS